MTDNILAAPLDPEQAAAAFLRDRGWTVTAPGEVRWVRDGAFWHGAVIGEEVAATVYDFRHHACASVTAQVHDFDNWDADHDYGTPEAAKAAVEKALKGEGR